MKKVNVVSAVKVVGMSFLAMAAVANAQPFGLGILPSIAVVGPQGEVIAYEKQGDEIVIRQCAPHTRKSEIESQKGCALKEGTVDVRLSEKDFRSIVKSKLSHMLKDPKNLSTEQKAFLEKALSQNPNLDEIQKRIKELDAILLKVREQKAVIDGFKAEYPNDYNKTEEEALVKKESGLLSGIETEQEKISGSQDIINARSDMESLVTSMITDMDGKKINRDLKHSKDIGKISFNLLKEIASVETFVTSKKAVFTRVEKEGFGKAWKDPSGMIWSELVGELNHSNATAKCQSLGGTLPSKEDYDRFRSYFDQQENKLFTNKGLDEVYAIMPDMKDRWFWSSSFSPDDSNYAFGFVGCVGDFALVDARNHNDSVRCVSR